MSAGRQDDLTILLGRVGEQYADPDDWRALIRAGRLRRVDSIAVRRPAGTTYQRADTVPELAALFEEHETAPAGGLPLVSAPSVAPTLPSTAVPPVRTDPVAARPEPGRQETAPAAPELARTIRPDPLRSSPRPADVRRPAPPPSSERPRRRKNGCGLGGLVLMAALGLAAFQLTRCAAGEGAITSADDRVTVYASRETRVRPEPVTGNTPLGLVARSDRLSGEWTTGKDGRSRWLRVAEGRYDGAYVWGANLATDAPPRLRETIDADWRVRTAGPVRAAPRTSAEPLTEVEAGQSLRVAGRVNDDWVEVLRSGGGVGYAAADLFETPSGSGVGGGEVLSVEVVDSPPPPPSL